MKNVFRILVAATACVGMAAANAQSITLSPTGSVKIGVDNDGGKGGGQGRDTAPGQLKKQYGGSATDYAPGQQKKDDAVVLKNQKPAKGGKGHKK